MIIKERKKERTTEYDKKERKKKREITHSGTHKKEIIETGGGG